MDDFKEFLAFAIGLSTGTIYFTLLLWAFIRRGK